ncbi:MAG: D-alanyl-D-alanine carboxypeptidase family protein [Ketobacteraceae bacterium]|nr:D-alanyl-D-alanine carboxypeptidase family protein [Ketobacteraceae bacterium]
MTPKNGLSHTAFFFKNSSKPILSTLISLIFVIASGLVHAAPRMIPSPPTLAADSWLLMDANSGHIIVEHNADKRLPPASLTKMMTTYIASEQIEEGTISMDDEVLVSEKAWRKGGSKMYIKVGTRVKLEDLLRGVIIQSGNDASIAIAEHIAGSEEAFADLMNQQALALGMENTHYKNATGWPAPDHYTTARDLAILARATIQDHPDDYAMYAEKEFTYNDIRQPNRNKLLWRDPSVDGIKTGHTEEAGYCLVASAERDGMRLISVVMGTNSENSRANESMKLLTYGFRFFDTVKSYEANGQLVEPEIWLGKTDTIQLGVGEDIWITIPRGAENEVKAQLDFPSELRAPVEAGTEVGTVKLVLDDKVLKETPLVALETVEEAGLFKRLWQHILLFIMSFFK